MTLTTASDSALAVRALVARAARTIVPTWPLDSFIAVNPMAGHTHRSVEALIAESLHGGPAMSRSEPEYRSAYLAGEIDADALRRAIAQVVPELPHVATLRIAERLVPAVDLAVAALLQVEPAVPAPRDAAPSVVDDLTSGWLSSLLGGAAWSARHGNEPLFAAFRRLAAHDRRLPAAARRRLAELPEGPEAVVSAVLAAQHIPLEAAEPVLRSQLDALPGWSGHVAWRATHERDITLTDLLAIRLALHDALGEPLPEPEPEPRAPLHDLRRDTRKLLGVLGAPADAYGAVQRVLAFLPPHTRLLIWQTAAEVAYRTTLVAALDGRPAAPDAPPAAQLMFCIDTRSEGLRRLLEDRDDLETFGFAGFFGTALRFRGFGATATRAQYPALLSGGTAVGELPEDPAGGARRLAALRDQAHALSSAKAPGRSPAAGFAWAEAAGLVSAGTATGRSLAPRRVAQLTGGLRGRVEPAAESRIDIADRLGVDERATIAEAMLRMTGLTRFAPLVVLTGHRAATRNNLYRSALDCGACGGNGGAPNARAAAAILNDPEVRSRLATRGLPVPDGTWFVAAEHETTTDTITLLDPHLVPASHTADVARVTAALRDAGDRLARERAADLPGGSSRTSLRRLRTRADDWAEMYPELGLAGNAAMLIAPRSVSRGADLGRRVFLHSYETDADPDGTALEAILTAPLIVGQWINAQYYCSTVDPERHGAGHKSLHNPVADIGVLTGSGGDLRAGLPWQSVAAGNRILHTPLRLSAFVQAPIARIAGIVARTDVLRDLVLNEWISLHARADDTEPWRQYGPYGFPSLERNDS